MKVGFARCKVAYCTGKDRFSTMRSRNWTEKCGFYGRFFPRLCIASLSYGHRRGRCLLQGDTADIWRKERVGSGADAVQRLDRQGNSQTLFRAKEGEGSGGFSFFPSEPFCLQLFGCFCLFQLLDIVCHGVVDAYGHLSCHKGIDVVILERHL